MNAIGTWLAALLTLALFTILYKENGLYRMAEHLFVGVGAGHGVIVAVDSYIRPTLVRDIGTAGLLIYIVPVLIGLCIYARFYKPLAWVSRITIAFLMGVGSAIIITKDFKPFFIDQVAATVLPLYVAGNLQATLNNLVIVVGVLGTLVYFLFTTCRAGATDAIARIGRWTMMIAFGSAFGNTVMARISLFVGRLQFLLGDWLKIITTQ